MGRAPRGRGACTATPAIPAGGLDRDKITSTIPSSTKPPGIPSKRELLPFPSIPASP